MAMSTARKGAEVERQAAKKLAEGGWVMARAAASKGDTKADLIGFHPNGYVALVQCKYRGELPPAEWNRLVEVAGWMADAEDGLPVVRALFVRREPKTLKSGELSKTLHLAAYVLEERKVPGARRRPMRRVDGLHLAGDPREWW